MEVATQQMIAASSSTEVPDIPTEIGGFYNCNRNSCKSNYDKGWDWDWDWRDKEINGVHYRYLGCFEFKSNGGSVKCQDFHGTIICEGTQWDLYKSDNGKYIVEECPDGPHH